MNYYRRYMADYLSKTAGLTLVEHGAYTLLLDYLYLSNGVLPGNEDEICRMVRAVKASERQAVMNVLSKFFVKQPNGYTNHRAVEEIEKAKPAIEAARTNGVNGGRPRKNPLGFCDEPKEKASHISTTNHSTTNHQPPTETISAGVAKTATNQPSANEKKLENTATWSAYAFAYQSRYGVQPVRNAKVNTQIAQLVKRLGGSEAPAVAGFYVRHNKALYVSSKHCVDLLLRDCEGLRTEWVTGRTVTDTEARQVDRKQSNLSVAEKLIAEERAKNV